MSGATHTRRGVAALAALALTLSATGCGDRVTTASASAERSAASTPTSTPGPTPTSSPDPGTVGDGTCGLDDPYYPDAGGGGMDVQSYDLTLEVDPTRDSLRGTARLRIALPAPLRSLCLDLVGLQATAARVEGATATVARESDRNLRVTPPSPVSGTVTVEIDYGGSPTITSTGTGQIDASGWFDLGDTAVALSEPTGSATWFPANDHPSDKATFSMDVTVPDALRVIANGLPDVLEGTPTGDGRRRFRWAEPSPMSPYLASIAVGPFEVTRSEGPGGLPLIHAVPQGLADAAAPGFSRTGDILSFFAERFGPYPFTSSGGVLITGLPGFALEVQTRPVYSDGFTGDAVTMELVVAHELAHQWFGDAVSPAQWDDIWLNEGLTTYAEWLWTAYSLSIPLAEVAREAYDGARADMDAPPADPGVDGLFGSSVYTRGGMAIYALSRTIGEDAVARLLRTWVDAHRGTNGSTADFTALVEQQAGAEAAAVLNRWVYEPQVPPFPG